MKPDKTIDSIDVHPPFQRGFTVLELLVTISIIGVLMGLLLPAIGSARESVRRVQCVSHLRQTSLDLMLCPSDITEPTFTLFEDEADEDEDGTLGLKTLKTPTELKSLVQLPTANYVGVFGTIEPDDDIPAPIGDGVFLENRLVRFRDFGRGLSNTIIVGERTMAQVPSTWFGVHLAGEDAAGRIVGSTLEGINNPLADECDFSSRHPGGANFLWGDGHVTFVAETVDSHEYHQWPRLRFHVNL